MRSCSVVAPSPGSGQHESNSQDRDINNKLTFFRRSYPPITIRWVDTRTKWAMEEKT